MVRHSWDIASFGELASGVPFRPWMTFHMFGPSEFDIAFLSMSFQLSVLASLITSVASRQALIDYYWFWCIVRWRQFRVWILDCTCEVTQGLDFLPGFVFQMCVVAVETEIRIALRQDIQSDKFDSSGRLFIFESTWFVKQYQSMALHRHLAVLETTG